MTFAAWRPAFRNRRLGRGMRSLWQPSLGPTPLVFLSPSTISQAENAATNFTLTTNRAGVTFAKTGGADAALFTLNGTTGAVTLAAKNFEAPTDADTNNTYVVAFTATDPATSDTATQTVTVTITNLNDTNPSAFTFTDQTGVALSATITSNTITVAGLGASDSAAVSVTGGSYSKNGGAYTTSAGSAVNGDTFSVRQTSSASNSTAVHTVLTIGTTSDTFTSTTTAGAITTLPTVSVAPTWACGARRLVAGYTGNLYQLIRASDSATLDIGQSGDGSADLSGVAAFGSGTTLRAAISYDQTGNGNHATQVTAASQPMFRTASAFRGTQPIDCGIVAANGNHDQSRFFNRPALSIDRQATTWFSVAGVAGGPTNSYGIGALGTSGTATANVNFLYDTTTNWAPFYVLDSGFQSGALSSLRTPSAVQPSIAAMVLGSAGRKFRFNGSQVFSFAALSSGTMTGGYIGRGAWASATLGPAHHYADVGYPAALSDTDAAAVEAALASIFDVLTSSANRIIFDGDSITNQETNGLYGRGFVAQAMPSFSKRAYTPDFGIAGQTMAAIYGRRAATLSAANNSSSPTNKLTHILGGTNDLDAAVSGSIVGVGTTIWTSYLLPYIQALQATGEKLVVGTVINRNWTGSTQDKADKTSEQGILNGLIKSNAGTYSYTVADYQAISGLSNPLGTNFADGVHPNEAGAALMAPVAVAAINAVL